jgi:hypothetical protein
VAGPAGHRRSIRLPGYDYAQMGAYFVTVCTQARVCVLGEVADGIILPSPIGHLVERCWRALPTHFPGVELDAFVVMPNHIHGSSCSTTALKDRLSCRAGRAHPHDNHRMEPSPDLWELLSKASSLCQHVGSIG